MPCAVGQKRSRDKKKKKKRKKRKCGSEEAPIEVADSSSDEDDIGEDCSDDAPVSPSTPIHEQPTSEFSAVEIACKFGALGTQVWNEDVCVKLEYRR